MKCKITPSLICIFFLIIPSVYPKETTSKQIKQAIAVLEAIPGKVIAKFIKIKDVDLKGGSYIENIKITRFDIPRISIKGDWKNSIVVEASNIGLGATADWRVKKRVLFKRYRESGTLTTSVSNVSFKVTLSTRTFEVANCSESIGHLKVKLEGKLLPWIVKKLVNVDKFLKRKLKGKICHAVSKWINKQTSKISRIMQRFKSPSMWLG